MFFERYRARFAKYNRTCMVCLCFTGHTLQLSDECDGDIVLLNVTGKKIVECYRLCLLNVTGHTFVACYRTYRFVKFFRTYVC